MDAATRAIFEGTDPVLLQPVKPAGPEVRLTEWFDAKLARAQSRGELFSVALLLQHKYFFDLWRLKEDQQKIALHSAYERCFEYWHERYSATDPPLPDQVVSQTTAVMSPTPDPEQDYTELFHDAAQAP